MGKKILFVLGFVLIVNIIALKLGAIESPFIIEKRIDYNIGICPRSIAVGDFNNDFFSDIAIGHYSGLSFVFNNQNGSFGSKNNYKGISSGVKKLATGDFNKDGHLDLALLIDNENGISIILNEDGNSFSASIEYYSLSSTPEEIKLTDVNNNTFLDIVVATDNGVFILLNKADYSGDFVQPQLIEITKGINYSSLAIADFDGSKKKIIVALVPKIQVGDYVIVHAGMAIEQINEKAAKESLQIWREMLDQKLIDKKDFV